MEEPLKYPWAVQDWRSALNLEKRSNYAVSKGDIISKTQFHRRNSSPSSACLMGDLGANYLSVCCEVRFPGRKPSPVVASLRAT